MRISLVRQIQQHLVKIPSMLGVSQPRAQAAKSATAAVRLKATSRASDEHFFMVISSVQPWANICGSGPKVMYSAKSVKLMAM